tara:strand:- start:27 stop:377 length:351 start_codon:yes stop_codon:yes gene_type:complete
LIVGGALSAVIVILVVLGLILDATRQSVCTVTAVQNTDDAFIVNGEFDYGIVTAVSVALEGPGRNVTVRVRLETNEGDIEKSRSVALSENGRRTIQIQFPEPTVMTVVNRSVAFCS